jgi:hypothetical protein
MSHWKCDACGSVLTDYLNPAIIGPLLRDKARWDAWALALEDTYYQNFLRGFKVFNKPVEVVDVKRKPEMGDIEAGYYGDDSEYPQGTSYGTYILFKIETTEGPRYYKVVGQGDSYGEVTWEERLREVKATPTTITVYEVVE